MNEQSLLEAFMQESGEQCSNPLKRAAHDEILRLRSIVDRQDIHERTIEDEIERFRGKANSWDRVDKEIMQDHDVRLVALEHAERNNCSAASILIEAMRRRRMKVQQLKEELEILQARYRLLYLDKENLQMDVEYLENANKSLHERIEQLEADLDGFKHGSL